MQPRSPLFLARKASGLTLADVGARIGADTGNLSRIERGIQVPGPALVEKLVELFSEQGLTEMQIYFPFTNSSARR